jgi:hypothetical protein
MLSNTLSTPKNLTRTPHNTSQELLGIIDDLQIIEPVGGFIKSILKILKYRLIFKVTIQFE